MHTLLLLLALQRLQKKIGERLDSGYGRRQLLVLLTSKDILISLLALN